jgi:hypothetical protein
VFHLGRRITLGVDVGNLLQLERAFEGDGKERQAAEEEHVVVTRKPLRDGADVGRLREDLAGEIGCALQGGDILAAAAETHVAHAADVEGEHGADHELRGEGLGGRDPDLGAGVLVDAAVGFAGDGGADDVGNGEDLVALALRFAQGGERVDGLARLAHHEEERVAVQRHVPVAELRGVVALDRDAGEALDQVFGHHAGVQAVPHPQNMKRSMVRNSPGVMLSPPNWAVLPSSEKRPRIAFSSAAGCSKISFSMKWEWSPSSASAIDQVTLSITGSTVSEASVVMAKVVGVRCAISPSLR